MKRHLITLASLVTVFVLCAASPRDLPPEVAAHLAEMDDVCKVVGTPVERPHVEHGYLGSDRLEIWAIDEGQYYCDGAASLYSGTAGSAVVVFMRLPDNHIKKVYDIFVYGMRLEHTGTSDTLWVNVAGKICGQPG